MKKGFTLAEVLITLAIIGVVAALTIPTTVANYQKKVYYSQFMKEYNALSRGFIMAQVKNGDISEWTRDTNDENWTDFLYRYLKDSMNITKVCYQASDCGIAEGATIKMLSFGDSEESSHNYAELVNEYGGGLAFADGSLLFWGDDSFKAEGPEVAFFLIDTNGPKGPNIYGRDLFFLSIFKRNRGFAIASMGSYDCNFTTKICEPKSNEQIKNMLDNDEFYSCSATGQSTGMGCAARLLLEGKMDY